MNTEQGNTAPGLVPDQLKPRQYNLPISLHNQIDRMATARQISASKMALHIIKRGIASLEIDGTEGV